MWGRFFDSIGGEDAESVLSGSHSQMPPEQLANHRLSPAPPHQSPQSEVHPNDSASVQEDDHASAVDGYVRGQRQAAGHSVITAGSTMPVDDGTYVFKFKTPSGRTHRFQSRHDNVEHLREIVAGKLATDPFFTDFLATKAGGDAGSHPPPDPSDFQLSYTDADGDTVLITADHDVTEAVNIARGARVDRVVLFMQGGKGWAEAGAGRGEARAEQVNTAAREVEKEVQKAEAEVEIVPPTTAAAPPVVPHAGPEETVLGIPKDLLLPASIGALAVVIIGLFTISRMADRY
jgi:hypothetical protein